MDIVALLEVLVKGLLDAENKFFENPKDFSWKLRDRKEPIFLVQLCQLDFDKYDGDLDYKL